MLVFATGHRLGSRALCDTIWHAVTECAIPDYGLQSLNTPSEQSASARRERSGPRSLAAPILLISLETGGGMPGGVEGVARAGTYLSPLIRTLTFASCPPAGHALKCSL